MGFATAHKIGTGMRISGPDTCIDVIVRGASGTQKHKKVSLEVRGLEYVPGMEITQGEAGEILKDGITVEVQHGSKNTSTTVSLYWRAPPGYDFESRDYEH